MRASRAGFLVAALSACALLSCVDGQSPVGLDGPAPLASLAVVPVFPVGAPSLASAPVNLIRLTVRRLPENEQVAQAVLAVDPEADEWELAIDVPLSGGRGTQYVLEIELLNDTGGTQTVEWSGRTAPLSLTPGIGFQTREVSVSRGPLDNLSVTALVVEGPTQVREQEGFALTAVAQTSQQGARPAVFWTSLDPTIASIGSDGRGQGLRAGTARIQAQAGPVTSVHQITVTAVPTSVRLAPTQAELTDVGQVATFTASVLDRSGTVIAGAQVTWTASDERVVEPLGGGRFRARGGGRVTVTATSVADPSLSATAALVVRLTPVEVVVTPSSATLAQVGETVRLTAELFAAGRVPVFGVAVNWSSSSPAVATVAPDGTVTAVTAGETVITATTEPVGSPAAPLRGTATVRVVLPAVAVQVTPATATLRAVGEQQVYQAAALDVTGARVANAAVTWTISNAAVATVSATGVVTAVADGTTAVTASVGAASGSASVTVDIAVGSVAVDPASVVLTALGQERTLVASASDPAGRKLPSPGVAWSSSDPAVVSVSPAGVVKALAEGTATVTAAVKGVKGSAAVSVSVAVGSVKVEPASVKLTRVGEEQALTATPLDADGRPVIGAPVNWSSSRPAVATVSAAGVVRAVSDGSAVITATSKGSSGTAQVTVDLAIALVRLEPASVTLAPGAEMGFLAAAYTASGLFVPVTLTWSSSNPEVAPVSQDGIVTARAPGTTVITASAKQVSATATVTVEVPAPPPPPSSTFETPGNTELVAGGYPRPGTAHAYSASNVLGGLSGLTVSTTGTISTFSGGSVDMQADGDFSYRPPPGFEGTDRFVYTVSGGGADTVEVEVVGMVWYVASGGAGDGRSHDPRPNLPDGLLGAPGDVIYLYEGDGEPVESGIVLKDGQELYGERVGLSLTPWGTLHPAGPTPKVAGPGLTLASNVKVAGLDVVGTDEEGILGNAGVTNVTVEHVRVLGSGGDGVALTEPTGSITFDDLIISGTGYYGFLVSGGNAVVDVTLGGPIGIQSPGRHIVRVQNTTGGSVTFDGGQILSVDQRGIKILYSEGDVTFNNVVTVTNPANDGLSVQGTSGDVYLAELHTTVTGRSGIHLAENSGTTTVEAGTIVTTGAPGLDLTNSAVDLTLSSVVVLSSPGNGLQVYGVTGSIQIEDGDISDTGGLGVYIEGGAPDFTYGGDISGGLSNPVYALDLTGGTVRFGGTIQATADGIRLGNSPDATFEFSGALDLAVGAFEAFNAYSAGVLEVTGGPNVASASEVEGAVVRIENTEIGPDGVTFQSVSADACMSAIYLLNTGTAGSFKVLGTGTAGSGGTVTFCGQAVYAVDTKGLVLKHMTINDASTGVYGEDVDGFLLEGLVISSYGGDYSLKFIEASGTGTLTGVETSGTYGGNRFENASAELDLQVTASTFENEAGEGYGSVDLRPSGTGIIRASFDDVDFIMGYAAGLYLHSEGSGLGVATLNDVTFTDNEGSQIKVWAEGGSAELSVSGSGFSGGRVYGVEVEANGTATARVEVSGSEFTGHQNDALRVTPQEGSRIDARFFDNVVDGVAEGRGVFGSAGGSATLNAWIARNDIANVAGGIYLLAGDGGGSTATGNLHVHDNYVDDADIILWQAESASACVSVSGNSTTSEYSVMVGQETGTSNNMKLERLNGGSGTVTSPSAVWGFLSSANPLADGTWATIVTGMDGVPTGTCALPVPPTGAADAPPVAHPQKVSTEGSMTVITLTGSDPDGSPLTFGIVAAPSIGSLGAITPLGPNSAQVTYTPAGSATTSFTFKVTSGGVERQAIVTVDNSEP